MRTIRASDIGTYLYCRRAWWYRNLGYEPGNQVELAGGNQLHYRHARNLMLSGCLRILALVLLLASLVILAIHFTSQLV